MEVDKLSVENILGQDEIDNLFVDTTETREEDEDSRSSDTKEEDETLKENKEKNKKEETTEVDINELFNSSESVSSGKENTKESEDASSAEESTSPKIYSSIAKAFAEEGIFPDLEEDAISKVKSPEDLRELIDQQIKAGLDERQKRVDEALGVGVESNIIRQYESTLATLNNLSDTDISAETENGEKLRK